MGYILTLSRETLQCSYLQTGFVVFVAVIVLPKRIIVHAPVRIWRYICQLIGVHPFSLPRDSDCVFTSLHLTSSVMIINHAALSEDLLKAVYRQLFISLNTHLLYRLNANFVHD